MMGFVWSFALYGVFFWYLIKLFRQWASGHRSLPGPWGLPVVGYMPFMDRRMNVALTELSKRFGEIYQVQLGTRQIVVLNSQRVIRKALLNRSEFSGRPDFYTYRMSNTFGFSDYTPSYRAYKNISQKAMAKFANVKNKDLQKVAHNAVQMLLDEFKKANNTPFDPKKSLYDVVCTIMGYICYGQFFTVQSPEVKTMLSKADEFGTSVVAGVICDYIPWAKFLMAGQLDRFRGLMQGIRDYSNKLAAVHIDSYDGSNMRDITDFFHKTADEIESSDEKKLVDVDRHSLMEMASGLFGAGFGTIAITLKWAFKLMAKYPEIQKEIQSEIDRVVGNERFPDFEDSQNLPMTEATIMELYRYSSIASLAITHSTTSDVEIDGYFVPDKTPVIINLYAAHRDPLVFKSPMKFNPYRFIKSDGSVDKTLCDYVIPYGLGHRRCGGELIARLEVFTFFSTVLQRCCIEEAPGHPLAVDDYNFTLALDPKPFKVIFRSRQGAW